MEPRTDPPSLSVLTVGRLLAVFKRLNWSIDSEVEGERPYVEVFNDFLELLAHLDSEEQQLVLTLCDDYLHCTSLQYSGLLNKALSNIPSDTLDKCKTVFLLPLKAPKDKGKVKSADGMLYMCRLTLPQVLDVKGKQFHKYTDPDLLRTKHANRAKSLILLVDDFIGSGDTAEDALQDYDKRIGVDDDEVIVVALVAQELGIRKITDLGFTAVAAHIRNRGISDNTAITDKSRAVELMRIIENQIEVSPKYSLGYRKSEALVSMRRTPNNTFPIFWWPSMPAGRLRSTPFKREAV